MLSNKMKRCLSFLMAMLMVVSLMPVSVLATDEETHDHSHEVVEQAAPGTQETIVEDETTTTGESVVPENPAVSPNPLLVEYQVEIDRILNEYGITVNMTEDVILDVINGEDFDYLYALFEVRELDAVVCEAFECGIITVAELNEFAVSNSTFSTFAQLLEDKHGTDTLVSFLSSSTDITGLTISDTANNLSVSGSTVTAKTSKGSWLGGKKSSTITITNSSGKNGVLSFSYTVSNYNSFTIDGAAAGATGSYSEEFAADGSLSLYIQSTSSAAATLVLSGITLSDPNAAFNASFTYDNNMGSITVDGVAVAPGGSAAVSGAGSTLVAAPKSGYSFYGWVNADTHELISNSASYSLKANANINIEPAFGSASTNAWFAVGSMYFPNLNDASTYANSASSKVIVPVAHGTLPAGDYSIPNGVTLLIPYNSANTLRTEPNLVGSHTTPTAFRTLTMASGANITVANGGVINVGSEASATGQNADSWNATPTGPHGRIHMNEGSTITLASGAKMYVHGYVSGSGSVLAKSGSTVQECFQIRSWRGGTAICGSTSNAAFGRLNSVFTDNDIFPVNQYYVQNIEAKLTLEGGATEKIFAAGNAASVTPSTTATFIGSGGMFNPASGKTVTKYYDASTDRLVVELDGDASMSSMAISFYIILGTMDLNTANFVLPLPSNITIKINSGTTTISQAIALVPGGEIIVADGATLKLSEGYSAFVYDQDDWGAYGASGLKFVPVGYSTVNGTTAKRTDASLIDAKIDVNGTVEINGAAYTTSNGANITSSEGTGKVIINAVGTETVTKQATQDGTTMTAVSIPITPAKLKNGTGDGTNDAYTSTTTGDYYYCATHELWYTGKCTKCQAACEHEWDNACDTTCNKGCGFTRETEHVPNTDDGNCTTAIVCSICNAETTAAKAAHTATDDGDCTTEHKCTNSGCTQVAIAAKTHVPATDDGDCTTAVKCTNEGCNVETTAAKAAHVAGEDDGDCTTAVKCVNCSKNAVEAAANHVAGADDNNCTTAVQCVNCSKNAVEAAASHNFAGAIKNDGDGKHSFKCTTEGCEAYGNATAHVYGDWVITKNATCVEEGSKTKSCACGDENVETIPATGHTYTGEWVWTEEGAYTLTLTCGKCAEGTEGKNHELKGTGTVAAKTEPGCETTGSVSYTASVEYNEQSFTNTSKVFVLAAINHNYSGEWKSNDTHHWHECANGCGIKGSEAEHDWAPATVDAPETCTECGKTRGEALTAVAQIGEQKYASLAKAIAAAESGDTIVLLDNYSGAANFAPIVLPAGVTLDLNCMTFTGAVAGRVMMSGGTLKTYADNNTTVYTMAGPEGSDAKYITSDMVFAMDTNWSMTIESGSAELGDNWRTLPGQTVIIGEDANVTVPTGKTFTVLGNVTIKGELTCDGSIVLGAENATLTMDKADGLNITTDVGDVVWYDGIKYVVHNHTPAEDDGDCTTAINCSVCRTVTTPAKDAHTGGEATCTAKAVCSECGKEYGEVDATNHVGETEVRNAKAATCGEAGYTGDTYCLDCGTKIADGEEIAATGAHSGGEASCKAKAECEVCGQSYGEVDATNHVGETVVRDAKAETCGAAGYTGDTYCLDCGEKIADGEEIPATGNHTGGEATCKAKAECEVCGQSYGNLADHAFNEKASNQLASAADCDNAATYYVQCDNCDAVSDSKTVAVGDPNAHVFSGKFVADGNTHKRKCANCNEYEVKDHDWDAGVITAPTCTEQGYTTYDCKNCDHSYQSNEVAAIGHDYNKVDWEWKKDAYTLTLTCEVCANGTDGKVLEYTGKGEINSNLSTPAECTTPGKTVYVATVTVGERSFFGENVVEIPAPGHTPAKAVRENEVPATCYAEGSYDEVVYCSVEGCGAELSRKTKTIEKAEHTPAEAVRENVVDASCYAEGSYDEVVYCSVEECKAELSRTKKTIEKAEHSYEWKYDDTQHWQVCTVEECNFENGKIDHSFDENGFCECGKEKPNTEPVIIFQDNLASLLLEGIIRVKQYYAFLDENGVDLPKDDVLANGGVRIYYYDGTYVDHKLTANGMYGKHEEYYVESVGIPAREMDHALKIVPYIVIDGVRVEGPEKNYGVLTYVEGRMENSKDENLKKALAALVNYGATMQAYKKDPAPYMNECLQEYVDKNWLKAEYLELNWNDELINTSVQPSDAMTVNFKNTNTITHNGNSLMLEGAISLNFYKGVGKDFTPFEGCTTTMYFWTEADYAALEAKGTPLSVDNATYSITNEFSNEFAYQGSTYGWECSMQSKEFYPQYLGTGLYTTMVITRADGTVDCSGVEVDSPEMFANRKLNDGTTAAIDDLVRWMVVYGERATYYLQHK